MCVRFASFLLVLTIFSPFVSATEVVVEGRSDAIDVEGMRSIALKQTRRIEKAFYDEESGYLIYLGRGNNTYYERCGVPREVVTEWESARSTAQYFMRNILNRFGCEDRPGR